MASPVLRPLQEPPLVRTATKIHVSSWHTPSVLRLPRGRKGPVNLKQGWHDMKAQGGGVPLIYFQQIFDDVISSVGVITLWLEDSLLFYTLWREGDDQHRTVHDTDLTHAQKH